MRNIRFTYRGRPWIAYLAPESDVSQMAEDPNCPAFVETAAKEIYFSDNHELNIINVLHELWHMAVSECHIASVNMDQHEMEEFTAELFANEGEAVLDLGKKLLKALNKLKNMKPDAEIHLDEEAKKD